MSLNVAVLPGGLLRCCLASIEQHYILFPDYTPRLDDKMRCVYCEGWMMWDPEALDGRGAWKWDERERKAV